MSVAKSDVVIFTAADTRFFSMCLGLVLSLLRLARTPPRIRVLDLGLSPVQVQTLTPLVEQILRPEWYSKAERDLPLTFRGLTARPHLPRYVNDAEILVWLDADTWVQEWSAVATLIADARSGGMAIVEEQRGPGVSIETVQPDGTTRPFKITAESMERAVRRCYRDCFGAEAEAKYGGMANFNGGVWALRRESPSWAVYGELIEAGLSRSVHPLVEQQALNIAIRSGRIAVAPQPMTSNYVMNHALPWIDTDNARFVMPRPPHETIGILHLNDLKEFSTLVLQCLPSGRKALVPIHFLDLVAGARS
ncbi:MAG TPA: hypothetical protein VKB68_11495 [Stellaceae bacterium]|nr:hypothetical protein [Stellaceae bacterium]